MAKPMDKKRAINLAIKALEHDKQKLAVDANAYTQYNAPYPRAQKAHIEYERLEMAIKVLQNLKENGNG